MKKSTAVLVSLLLSISFLNFYSVIVKADTFGNTEPGSTSAALSNDILYLSRFQMLSSSMKAYSMSIYQFKGAGVSIKMAIYSDSSGEPNNLIANTSSYTITQADGTGYVTIDLDTNPMLSANTYYWLAIKADKELNTYVTDSEDIGRDVTNHFDENFPDTITKPDKNNWELSIYCTVQPSDSPVISNPSPPDGAKHIRRYPHLSVQINSSLFPVDISWQSNSSGSWVEFGVNSSINQNGTYSYVANNFTSINTKYWWRVNVSHNSSCYTLSNAYSLTIAPDELLVQIVFAGANNVRGGTYYFDKVYGSHVPSDMVDERYLNYDPDGVLNEGFYVNGSHQISDYINIRARIYTPYNVTSAYLHWKNMDTNTWDNTTSMTIDDSYWQYTLVSYNKTVNQRGNYSFDIYVTDSNSSSSTHMWTKRSHTGNIRRTVELDCNAVDSLNYRVMYYRNYPFSYTNGMPDILPHDGGTDGSASDTGQIISELPSKTIEERHCAGYVGYWFEDEVILNQSNITNVYFHDWWNTTHGFWENGIGYSKNVLSYSNVLQSYSADSNDAVATMSYDYKEYYLTTKKLTLNNPLNVDTNGIYCVSINTPDIYSSGGFPSFITNRSILSFVIFNIPDNTTLQGKDTDSDGLNDYQELFTYHTNPFLIDTDNDGSSDKDEVDSSTDPNDYRDTPKNSAPYAYNPYPANNSKNVSIQPTCHVRVHDEDMDTLTVKFYENTTGSWTLRQTNSSVKSGFIVYWHFTQASQSNTNYWWKVEISDGSKTSTFIYTFKTVVSGNHAPTLTNPSATPSSGVADYTTFYFNITYTDQDGDAPSPIKVNISKTGWYSNVSMTFISGDYTSGASYSYSTTLSTGTYDYLFYASDGTDSVTNNPSSTVTVEEQSIDISVVPTSYDWGFLESNSVQNTSGGYFNITNTGNVNVDITIRGTNATNATGVTKWILVESSSPGNNQFSLQYSTDQGSTWDFFNWSDNPVEVIYTNLAPQSSLYVDLKLVAPLSTDCYDEVNWNVYFGAVQTT